MLINKTNMYAAIFIALVVSVASQCPSPNYVNCCDYAIGSSCNSDEECRTQLNALNGSNPPLKCSNSRCIEVGYPSTCSAGTGYKQNNDCSVCKKFFGLEFPACIPVAPGNQGYALIDVDPTGGTCCYLISSNCKSQSDCNRGDLFPGGYSDCIDSNCYYVSGNTCEIGVYQLCDYNDVRNKNCNSVAGYAPTPTPAPVPTPTPTLTPALVPTPTPAPVPTPTPTSPSSNGGVSCIAHDQTVFEENKGKVNVSTLKIGDKILTHNGFQDFIGYIHEGSFQHTLIITTDTNNIVELTKDHLIKVENSYVHAKHVVVGSHLSSGQVIKIIGEKSFVVSPLTRSGTILVNNVILSCYANVFSHNIANFALVPLRINIVKNINKYFSALIAVYNVSPKWFRHITALNDSYTF